MTCSSRVVEVIDLDSTDGWPSYTILPEHPTRLQATSTPPVMGVLGSLAATVVMFDDAPCPALDQSLKYWVSIHGASAGVFNSRLVYNAHDSLC